MSNLSRRVFLGTCLLLSTGVGVGAGLLSTAAPDAEPAATPTPLPDRPEIVTAVQRELDLIDELSRAAANNAKLADRVHILNADHRAHAQALQALLSQPVTRPPHASPAISHRQAGIGHLVSWERAAGDQAMRECAAADAALAPLLASIAACEASHVAWLS